MSSTRKAIKGLKKVSLPTRDKDLPTVLTISKHPRVTGDHGRIFVLLQDRTTPGLQKGEQAAQRLEVPQCKAEAQAAGFPILNPHENEYVFTRDVAGDGNPAADILEMFTMSPKSHSPELLKELREIQDEIRGTPDSIREKQKHQNFPFLKTAFEETERAAPNRRGARCYTLGTSFQDQTQVTAPQKGMKAGIKEPIDGVRKIIQTGAKCAMAGLKEKAPEIAEIMEDRAVVLNTPRIGSHENVCFPSMQLNIAPAVPQKARSHSHLSDSIGVAGGAHTDPHDSAGCLTCMINLSKPHPQVETEIFNNLSLGISCYMNELSGLYFSGLHRHSGGQPVYQRGNGSDSPYFRVTLICYPPAKLLHGEGSMALAHLPTAELGDDKVDEIVGMNKSDLQRWVKRQGRPNLMKYYSEQRSSSEINPVEPSDQGQATFIRDGLGIMAPQSFVEFVTTALYHQITFYLGQGDGRLNLNIDAERFFRSFSYRNEEGEQVHPKPKIVDYLPPGALADSAHCDSHAQPTKLQSKTKHWKAMLESEDKRWKEHIKQRESSVWDPKRELRLKGGPVSKADPRPNLAGDQSAAKYKKRKRSKAGVNDQRQESPKKKKTSSSGTVPANQSCITQPAASPGEDTGVSPNVAMATDAKNDHDPGTSREEVNELELLPQCSAFVQIDGESIQELTKWLGPSLTLITEALNDLCKNTSIRSSESYVRIRELALNLKASEAPTQVAALSARLLSARVYLLYAIWWETLQREVELSVQDDHWMHKFRRWVTQLQGRKGTVIINRKEVHDSYDAIPEHEMAISVKYSCTTHRTQDRGSPIASHSSIDDQLIKLLADFFHINRDLRYQAVLVRGLVDEFGPAVVVLQPTLNFIESFKYQLCLSTQPSLAYVKEKTGGVVVATASKLEESSVLKRDLQKLQQTIVASFPAFASIFQDIGRRKIYLGSVLDVQRPGFHARFSRRSDSKLQPLALLLYLLLPLLDDGSSQTTFTSNHSEFLSFVTDDTDKRLPFRNHASSLQRVHKQGLYTSGSFGRAEVFSGLIHRGVSHNTSFLQDKKTLYSSLSDWNATYLPLSMNKEPSYFCNKAAYGTWTSQRDPTNASRYWDAAQSQEFIPDLRTDFRTYMETLEKLPAFGPLTSYLLAADFASSGHLCMPDSTQMGGIIHKIRAGAHSGLDRLGYSCSTEAETTESFCAIQSGLKAFLTAEEQERVEFGPILVEHSLCKLSRFHGKNVFRKVCKEWGVNLNFN